MWGFSHAAVGWVTSQLFASIIAVSIIIAGGWDLVSPARPGGYFGRVVGQAAAGEEIVDTSPPLLVTMLGLVPLWFFLLAVPWFGAYAFGHARPGWRIRFAPRDVPLGVFTGLILQIPLIPLVYVVIEAIFGEITPSERAFALVDQIDGPIDIVIVYLFVAVGAPVVEELFYRGLVQRSLVDRMGPALGIGTASLIFGAVHLSLIEFPALVVVGAAFGLLHWRTGRLGAPIIAHVTFNAFTLTTLLAAGGAF